MENHLIDFYYISFEVPSWSVSVVMNNIEKNNIKNKYELLNITKQYYGHNSFIHIKSNQPLVFNETITTEDGRKIKIGGWS